MEWKQKRCINCGDFYQPTGSRQERCEKCKKIKKEQNKKIPEDTLREDVIYGSSPSWYAVTCIECKKVPEGEICVDRCGLKGRRLPKGDQENLQQENILNGSVS